MVKAVRHLAEDDLDIESVVNLPDCDEILGIIEKAIFECVYEPYLLLEKRVL